MLTLDREKIAEVCRRFAVQRLTLFGSARTGQFDSATSDIDLLVEFASDRETDLFDAYFGLKDELEAIFRRPVDLVMRSALDNPYFAASVREQSEELYAA